MSFSGVTKKNPEQTIHKLWYIYVHLQALAYFLGFIPVTTNSLPPSDMIKVY